MTGLSRKRAAAVLALDALALFLNLDRAQSRFGRRAVDSAPSQRPGSRTFPVASGWRNRKQAAG